MSLISWFWKQKRGYKSFEKTAIKASPMEFKSSKISIVKASSLTQNSVCSSRVRTEQLFCGIPMARGSYRNGTILFLAPRLLIYLMSYVEMRNPIILNINCVKTGKCYGFNPFLK